MAKTDFQNIDEYISTFPEKVRPVLEQIRETIKKVAPKAEEVISYQMPAFKYSTKPLPLEMIIRIVKFRMKENLERAEMKEKKKK